LLPSFSIYPTITRLISLEGKDMRISVARIGLTWLALALSAHPKVGTAAEIRALMSIGVQSVIEDLAPKFEKASGHRLVSVFGLSAPLSRRVTDGETADLLIGTREGVDELIKAGKIVQGSNATLAGSGVGIAVRKGEPKPDISTPEALKGALLATRSIGYGNPAAGGAGGVHFAKVIERLGIVDQMKPKTKYPMPGGFVGSMLVSGEVDLGVQLIPELIFISGIELVGPLPGDLQGTTVFAAGVPSSAKEPNAARALITFLRSPEAALAFKTKGFETY
jgi:molybdate transport system substrate-binding protein